MKNKRHLIFLILSPIATLLLLACHELLPLRTLTILTDNLGDAHLYADNENGGKSEAIWLDEKNHAWHCRLRKGAEFPYCGMSTLPTGNHTWGLDLSGMDKVILQIGYQGPAEKIRFYIRNFDPEIIDSTEVDSGKFMYVQLNSRDLSREITLSLNAFSVADWWIDRYKVERQRARPSFDNVVNVGLDFANPFPYGDHIIAMRKIEFVGEWISAEAWYLSIIGLWIAGFVGFAVWRWSLFYQHARKNNRRIAELASYNQQLLSRKEEFKYLSKTDALTGALNRLGFTQAVENVLDQRNPGEAVSLILFSIDKFKRIKDTLNLNETDTLLQSAAALVADNSRSNHLMCRWEGEEFILLCPDTMGSSAYILADQIRRKLLASGLHKSGSATITLSAGVAEIEADESFAAAFKKIDDALFKARSLGGNCIIMA